MNLSYHAIGGLVLLVVGAKALDRSMRLISSKRTVINKEIDNRASLTQELLQSIRFVKYQAWEDYFQKRIAKARASEIMVQYSLLNIRNIITALSSSLPSFAGLLSFISFALTSGKFSAAEILSSLALFNCLRKPLNILPLVMSQLIDACLSAKRIEEFLLAEEHLEYIKSNFDATDMVQVEHGDFIWKGVAWKILDENTELCVDHETLEVSEDGGLLIDSDAFEMSRRTKSKKLTLQDISLTISHGELVAVIGDVGSGKSSLLSAINGDMNLAKGQVVLGSSRVYCPQNPWIMSGSVKENILFGKPFDQSWYQQVVEACALQQDIETFIDGYETQIGERGITLSGGQKQRLSLARGIYSKCELILLDDPLSAVDVHVGDHIFAKVIWGLLAQKCRIVATHQLQFLYRCDKIIWMEKGRIRAMDKFSNLWRTESDFVELFRNANGDSSQSGSPSIDDGLSSTLVNDQSSCDKSSKGEDAILEKGS